MIKKVFRKKTIIICALVLLVFLVKQGDSGSLSEYSGKFRVSVISIIDGDSIMVRRGVEELEIRLWGIDAPEYDQPHARAAYNALRSVVIDSDLTLEVVDRDKYDRLVVIAQKDRLNVNEYMVRTGYAWVHIYYCKAEICKKWYKLQAEARRKKGGLWEYDSPIPPWTWKAEKKRK